jgi:hypothetical protein
MNYSGIDLHSNNSVVVITTYLGERVASHADSEGNKRLKGSASFNFYPLGGGMTIPTESRQ